MFTIYMEIKEDLQALAWSREIAPFQVHIPTTDFIGRIRIERSIHLSVYIKMQSITDILCIATEIKQVQYRECQGILFPRNKFHCLHSFAF